MRVFVLAFVTLAFVTLALGLGACASKEQVRNQEKAKKEVANLDSGLRVGMSLADVKKINADVGDCRGSAKSYMTCQARFMTKAGVFLPIVPTSGEAATADSYTLYTLDFEKDQLKRWSKSDETWVRK